MDALSQASRKEPLYFVDLNAISPSTCKGIASLFQNASVPVRFIDGCILGAPPRPKSEADPGTNDSSWIETGTETEWHCPNIPVSGPDSLSSLAGGQVLASVLNIRSISAEIGAASGLKMCFAATAKGCTAVFTQAFTTAHRLGVAEELEVEMRHFLPDHLGLAQRSLPVMPPKAYRWVHEMEEISDTMHQEGGWGKELFQGAAGVYRTVVEDTVLGQEKIGKRTRGTNIQDVAVAVAEGLDRKGVE
jgi:hypothetical protein